MTQELKTIIRALLLEICPNVYYEDAPPEKLFPHIVFDLNCFFSGDRWDYSLELNVWDRSIDTEAVDVLADACTKALDHRCELTDTLQYRIYRATRNKVEDPDPEVRRRRLTFDLYAYERSNT